MTPRGLRGVALASIALAASPAAPTTAAPTAATPAAPAAATPQPGRTGTAAPATGAPATTPTTAAAGIAPARWRPGERRRYRLAFHSVLTPQGSSEQIALGWTGRLSLVALDVGGGRTVLAAEFSGRAETNQDARVRGELDAGLREPWFAVIGDDGRALEVGLTARMPTAVASAWKSLLGELQFVGATTAAASWTVDEDDPTGRYHASYAPAGAPATWRKTRSDYVALHPRGGAPADQPAYRVEAAETVFRFDAGSRPAGIDVHGRVVTRSQPPIPVFTADTRIALALDAADTAPPASLAALGKARAAARFASLASGPDERMQRDELDRGALARVSVPELFAQLDAGPPPDAPSRERRARVDRLLGALLRQQPARTREIERRAAAARPDRDALREILRDAGTPEAQAALLRLARLPALPARDRGAAIQALGLVRQPTGETIAQIERLLDDATLGVQARFSLAAAALQLRTGDAARANRAVDVLLARLARAAAPGDALSYVRALGNAGDPRTLDELERRLRAAAPELRDAAAWSLRSIASPRAEDLLIELAATGDEAARASAVRTLAFRPLTGRSEPVLAARLRSDPSPRVRDGVLRATPHLLRRSAALRDAFAWCAGHDALPQLRDAATRALGASSLAAAP